MMRDLRRGVFFAASVILLAAVPACLQPTGRGTSRAAESHASRSAAPRPAVIGAEDGERRHLRGGVAPLLIKVDPLTTGSRRMVLGSSDLPPGDRIAPHRHLAEDEIILILRGTARVRLDTSTTRLPPAGRSSFRRAPASS
jgi:quercetin dioxygenase-like cupin family protein